MRFFYILLFSLLCTFHLEGQVMNFRVYNHKDGLHISTLNCITQSEDGLIWIGTGGGDIVQFDGTSFTDLSIQENSNFHINNIIFDDDNILFSSSYTGFYSYNLEKKIATKYDLRSFLYGESKAILKDDGATYFLGSLKFISQKGDHKPKVIFASKKDIVIYNHFKSPIGIILFTNQGDFILDNGELTILSNWLQKSNTSIDGYKFGFSEKDQITFFHQSGKKTLQIKINNNKISSSIITELDISTFENDRLIRFNYNKVKKQPAFITASGQLITLDENNQWTKILCNTKEDINKPNYIFSDFNGDYWITTVYDGLIKISDDPFIQMKSTQLFEAPNNYFLYRFSDGVRLISNSEGKTFIEKSPDSEDFESYNFSTFAITYNDSSYFLATSNGLRVYDLNDHHKLNVQFYKNQVVSYVTSFESKLFIALSGKGIQIYDIESHAIQKPISTKNRLPEHIYTSQLSFDEKNLFLGTNNGIYKLDIKTNIIEKIDFSNELGSYSGISTKDKYGTIWFTIERGIIGISKDDEYFQIKGKEYFNSTLFYTMMADNYGDLFIGTNKGITYLRVNDKGEVLKKILFNEKNNYDGYETNMRSQFRKDDMIYFGTIEGIIQINTELLENLPIPSPPSIQLLNIDKNKTIDQSNIYVEFNVNNPKINSLFFQYRLNKSDWITIPFGEKKIIIKDLNNGIHTIDVRSSYNGVAFSKPTTSDFEVKMPFWSSTVFIALIILFAFIFNFIILNYYKKFKSNNLIDSKDINFHFSLTPSILLFSAITVPLALIVVTFTDQEYISLSLGICLVTTFILLILFSASLKVKKNNKTNQYSLLLKIALFTLLTDYFLEFYNTNGHPYLIIGLILILSIVPYIYIKVKEVILFSIVILFVSVLLLLFINHPVYPKAYFIYAISILCFLNIFYSYLRYNSLEKLIFISTIINKGNMPVIAFDKEGTINYCSENISSFIDTDYSKLQRQNIKILNNFIPFESSYKKSDITKDFKDGERYLVPMEDNNHKVIWIEWAFKNFSKNVNLILGQDVSEKMELENTYELLVQHAEDFIFKCDINGNFKFVNNVSFQRLGYTKEELIDSNSFQLVSPKHRDEVSFFYKRHFDQNQLTSYKEFPILTKKGEEIWIGQSITTLFSPGTTTQIDGFIALARDITEERTKNELIREQSESIKASINYARRIQHNLLPSNTEFKDIFEDFFIFSRPKDIVSGDFYWMEKIGKKTILVLGDCTGHGVPGSFMTLLGFNLLNSTVLENRITDPAQILNRIDKKLLEYLPKGEGKNSVNDAMELTVCVFNEKTNDLSYACAGSRFLICENGEFTMFKGDNKHAGDIEEKFNGYNTHFATFESDFCIYLFTDGFQDQFGGVKDKKFSFRRLIELFESNINLPMKEQQRLITETFDNWIGDSEQTDDVTVLSVKQKLNK